MINRHLGIGALTICVLYIFWLILGENSYVLIHDNLDSELVYILQLLKNKNVLGIDLDSTIPGIMNGINRFFFRSGFNLTFLIFFLLPPFKAYVVNHALVHLIGYFGMYAFLKRFFNNLDIKFTVFISFIYGTLPYYSIPYGISIAGLPLIFLAYINILRNEPNRINWLVIILFPFFSFLPVTLPFIIPVLFLILAHYLIYEHEKSYLRLTYFIIALMLYVVINLIIEFNLFYSTFFSNVTSHRVEFSYESINLKTTFKGVIHSMIKTPYHAGSIWVWPVVIAIFLPKFLKVPYSSKSKLIFFFVIFLFIISPITEIINSNYANILGPLKSIEYKRFLFLTPMFLMVLLGSIFENFKWSVWTHRLSSMSILSIVMISSIINNSELTENINLLFKNTNAPTYKSFFAEKEFTEIRKEISINDTIKNYNIISIGLHPSIAQYNGFNTLDSYQNNYSLNYKHQFRKIIEKELEKSDILTDYFDKWGSRCYAFSSILLLNFPNKYEATFKLPLPEYNWAKLKSMNGLYVISSCELDISDCNQLKYLNSFESSESFWKIWLYKVQ